MECHDILLEQRVDHGGEGVIFGSHGEGDLTVLEKISLTGYIFMSHSLNISKLNVLLFYSRNMLKI